jgi:spermidine synthase
MWPGEALTLRVNQILHHEKSKYQDVLFFESSDHGTVLILDNVIQCTERDEFSYVSPSHFLASTPYSRTSGTKK